LPVLDVVLRHRFDSGFTLEARFQSSSRATALFGPSGAGKTTILNAVAGLLRPTSGRIAVGDAVLYDGRERTFVPPHQRRLGYVFQDHRLFPHLDVDANLRFGMRPSGRIGFRSVVDALELSGLLHRMPAQLSGGQQQRVALGRALLSSPRLLLMDEPLASLDDERRGRILEFLERFLLEFSVPLLFVSHSQAEVRRLADHVVLLDAGRVIAEGTPAEVLERGKALDLHGSMGLINLLKLERVDEIDGRIVGRVGTMELSLPTPPESGRTAYVTVEPSAVTLAVKDVHGVSARNHLSGVVAALIESGGRILVAVDVGPTLWVEVTRSAVAELGLKVGLPVVCLLKAQSLRFV
jgi:molybdate transport system ATP-binding protein